MILDYLINGFQILSDGRTPTLDDRALLPYCEATVMEIQRLSCVAPASLPHMAKEDGKIDGYKIPKGGFMAFNITAFHLDPDFWEEPEMFNPDRFLDGKNREQFVPYGMGKRICMGESLARAELFIFSALVLQNFKIDLPVGHERPDPETDLAGVTRAPMPFYVNLSIRE